MGLCGRCAAFAVVVSLVYAVTGFLMGIDFAFAAFADTVLLLSTGYAMGLLSAAREKGENKAGPEQA